MNTFKKHFLSLLFLFAICLSLIFAYNSNMLLAAGPTTTSAKKGILIPTKTETGLPDGTISSVLDSVLNWLLMIFVVIATISFVITGLQFIFSFGGSTGTESQAKKNFAYTIIAIFIVGGSLIILNAVIGLLGGNSSSANNFGDDPNAYEPSPYSGQTDTFGDDPNAYEPSPN